MKVSCVLKSNKKLSKLTSGVLNLIKIHFSPRKYKHA